MSYEPQSLPREEIVQLILSNGFSTQLICTPDHLQELALGWLFTQRIIHDTTDVLSVQVCTSGSRILVQVSEALADMSLPARFAVPSGCSGGSVNTEFYRSDITMLQSPLTSNVSQLRVIISRMFEDTVPDVSTGGIHCAAIANREGKLILTRTDIGRHNAVDKVIGAALTRNIDFAQVVLATSGRISSDMVLKAVRAGIPIVSSSRSVTTLADKIARKAGIAIVGRLGKRTPIILGKKDRITGAVCRES